VTDSTVAYLPTDRRHALAAGRELREHTSGAALFADISGFTPLTEALVLAHGARHGAEHLLLVLNRIYDALIAEVDARRGSVIVFSGDAITCWFDDDGDGGWGGRTPPSAAARAVAAGLAVHAAMASFAEVDLGPAGTANLAVKVAVTTGPARRMIVGDDAIQRIDTLAGRTIERLAFVEHEGSPGEVIVDRATVDALGDDIDVVEWRTTADATRGVVGDVAVVGGLRADVAIDPWPELTPAAIDPDTIRSWMIPPVADRLAGGEGEWLTELRPAISLFVRFDGIDYDGDPDARHHLDGFVSAVQRVLRRFDAFILQVTIGDKGSYVNTTFGAPIAHGDEAVRALTAALELRSLASEAVHTVQIGIAQGRLRAGACGGRTRRCYGVMGDAVNLSARLMQRAAPGEVLVESGVRRGTDAPFGWLELEPITVKGKAAPVAVGRLVGPPVISNSRLLRRSYALPMFGRDDERRTIVELVDAVCDEGRGRVVVLSAEAGLGKSRLITDVVGHAVGRGMRVHADECHSFGVNAAYHAWHTVWRGVLDVEPDTTDRSAARRALDAAVEHLDPSLLERVPLLGPAVFVELDDTVLTAAMEPALRKASTEELLVALLTAAVSVHGPAVIVLEDAHWLDPMSADLLAVVTRAVVDLPVLVLVSARPPDTGRGAPRALVPPLAHVTELTLGDLADHDLRDLAAAKLRAVSGSAADPPPSLLDAITRRAEGNPFYVEELINYLGERGVDMTDPAALRDVDLPDSLHHLILGRIDQLTEDHRSMLKVASVIGRLFGLALVWGVHRPDDLRDDVRRGLDVLVDHDLTVVDSAEPELVYLFRHVLTQEVVYDTVPSTTRAALHGRIATWLETKRPAMIDQSLDLLAHHYDRSNDLAKRREYLRRAGERAMHTSANVSAADYFRRALGVLDGEEDQSDRAEVLVALGAVLDVLGEWADAESANRAALDLADVIGDEVLARRARRALGVLDRKRGDYGAAVAWFESVVDSARRAADHEASSLAMADFAEVERLRGRYDAARRRAADSRAAAERVVDDRARTIALAHALKGAGTIATWQGDYDEARRLNDESMALRRIIGDLPGVAVLLNNQGIIARFRHRFEEARALNDEALALFREIGDRWSTGQLLNNQACIAADLGDHAAALEMLDECLTIRRLLGDRAGLNLSLVTLADVLIDSGRADEAGPVLDESLALCRELDDRTMLAYAVEDLAAIASARGDHPRAVRTLAFAAAVRDRIGAPLPPNERARIDRLVGTSLAALDDTSRAAAVEIGRTLASTDDIDTLIAN
jgi:class 3 adenylate cyclase/tetratricopeptide (TPR) repeat protein